MDESDDEMDGIEDEGDVNAKHEDNWLFYLHTAIIKEVCVYWYEFIILNIHFLNLMNG